MDNKNFPIPSLEEIICLVSKNKDFFKIPNSKFIFAFVNTFDIENDFVEIEVCHIPNVRERTKIVSMTFGEFVDIYNKTYGIEY